MKIKAHPTIYRGATFRSRLEARWAAFFDLAGWAWQYEPNDYEGWVPDFALVGHAATILVEVKPINWAGSHDAMVAEANARLDLRKAVQPEADGPEVLVLGAYPLFESVGSWSEPVLGLLYNEDWSSVRPDVALIWAGHRRPLDFAAAIGSYRYRIGGEHDGDHHLTPVSVDLLRQLWHAAGTAVQWRAPNVSR